MYSSYILLSLAACIIAAPSPARIEVDISVEDIALHGASRPKHVSLENHALETTGFCIPFFGHQCASGDQSYDCCPPFSCMDDGSGDEVKRCLSQESSQDQVTSIHKSKQQPKLSITDDGDDDICLPPWEDGHMICGIGQPKYKCCYPDIFECKQFGRSGMYGCQPRQNGGDDDEVVSPVGALDDDICLPPWNVAHIFCGIGLPKYRCCGPDMECRKLEPESNYYGCKLKDGDWDGAVLKKLFKGESVFRSELL